MIRDEMAAKINAGIQIMDGSTNNVKVLLKEMFDEYERINDEVLELRKEVLEFRKEKDSEMVKYSSKGSIEEE